MRPPHWFSVISSIILLTTTSVTVGVAIEVALLQIFLGGRTDLTRWPLVGPVFDIALRELQHDYGDVLNFTQIRFNYPNISSCWQMEEKPALWVSQYYYNDSRAAVTSIFGTGCWTATETIGHLAREWNIPYMIPNDSGLGDKTRFPTVTRLAPYLWSRDLLGNTSIISRLMAAHKWTSAGYLCTGSYYSSYECRTRYSKHAGTGTKRNQNLYRYNLETKNAERIKFTLDQIKSQSRVIFIFASKSLIRTIMLAAADLGMTNGDYVYYAFDYYEIPVGALQPLGSLPWLGNSSNSRDEDAKLAYRSLFIVTLANAKTPEYLNFSREVQSLSARSYNYTYTANEKVNPWVMAEYYAMKILGVVLNETVILDGADAASNGAGLNKRMWNRTYNILGRQIVLDENGDRVADWVVNQLDPGGNAFRPVLQWSSSMKIFTAVTEEDGTPRQIVWYNRTSLPADRTFPADNHDSTDSGTQRGTAAVAIGCSFMAVILLVAIVLAVFYRKIIWNKLRPAGFGIPPVLFRNEI